MVLIADVVIWPANVAYDGQLIIVLADHGRVLIVVTAVNTAIRSFNKNC
jgi:hypothetical protein